MVSTTVTPQTAKGLLTQIERTKLERERLLEVFTEAIALAATKERWANGEIATLYDGTLRGLKAKIFIRNDSGKLNLYLFSEHPSGRLDKRFYSRPFMVGLFRPDKGWCVIYQDSQAYLDWNRAVNIVCHQKMK